MGKKIIFIDSRTTRTIRYMTGYNYGDCSFYIDYWDMKKTFIDKTRLSYPVEYTVIFSIYDSGDIYVRSEKCISQNNLRIKNMEHSSDGLLYPHIFEAFEIFDDINAKCKSKGEDPVWMLEFDLDDRDMSAVFNAALTRLFDSFTLSEPACTEAMTELYRNYHPSSLYNMMVKNLIKRDHNDRVEELKRYLREKPLELRHMYPESLLTEEGKARFNKMQLICGRGNGKTALMQTQLYRMMLNSTYGIGGSKMDNKLYNFRKNIKEIKRDKKNPGKFILETKDGFLSREIVCDGFTTEELYSEEFIETILVIATQIQYDGITKVIFNKEEKLTIIFPHNSYNFSERIIVKATGLDGFDLLCGYSIAKAKMLCSGDGYQWYNKLRKSGKVDV